MDFFNKLSKFMRNTGPARMLVPMGIFLLIFGILSSSFIGADMVETTGKVISVEEVMGDDNKTEYDIGVSYTVDGKEYTTTFANLPESRNVGDPITVYYNAENPEMTSNSKGSGLFSIALMAAGVLAIICGIAMTAKAFKKSKELEKTDLGKDLPAIDFDRFKYDAGTKEIYCLYDGNTLKPGYILEDADRNVLYEGKMTKNSLVGDRVFEFTDHTKGTSSSHQVGHTVTQTFSNEFFSATSWFKFDGKNVWDVLHDRGLRMKTNLFSKFPNLVYEVSKDGGAFARIETSSKYVHEEDEAQHKIAIPVGRYYYRIWTKSTDFETLFLTVFAISETEQTMVE